MGQRTSWENIWMENKSDRAACYAMLSHFSRVRLCATPQMAAHQAPPSLGFSRQEYWSRVPLPSPMHESEKRKWSRSVVSNSYQPHGLQPTRLLCPWDFAGKSTGVGCHCLLRIPSIDIHKIKVHPTCDNILVSVGKKNHYPLYCYSYNINWI